MLRISLSLSFLLTLISCSSKPIIPTADDIKVSREAPHKNCKEMGTLTGKTPFAKGTKEEAVQDLKEQAANKGADHVQIKAFSDSGTAVTGMLFECPQN